MLRVAILLYENHGLEAKQKLVHVGHTGVKVQLKHDEKLSQSGNQSSLGIVARAHLGEKWL